MLFCGPGLRLLRDIGRRTGMGTVTVSRPRPSRRPRWTTSLSPGTTSACTASIRPTTRP
ncbi:MAG: hypothetical protein M0C28_20410 [Candidatus Moduliflexus flocculans]|nr:hypothetical protein [Candidatus Moduliflexus flocculans]